MFRKTTACLILGFLAAGILAGEGAAPVSKKAGYALIDSYILAFKNMALTGGKESLETDLNKMVAEAKKAKAGGDIDAVFLARFSRLVAVTKLALLKDPEKVLAPFLEVELSRFVREILGEDLKKEGPGAIGQLANALAFSIVDLQIYLDTIDSRQQRYDKFVKGFNPGK